MKIDLIFPLIIMLIVTAVNAGTKTGIVEGNIIDRNTLMPLAGANIVIENTQIGTVSDQSGNG